MWLDQIILQTVHAFTIRSVMALTRGVKGLYPCLRCLIRNEQQGNVLHIARLRTTTDMRAILLEARSKKYIKEQKVILKAAGLRNINVSPYYIYYNMMLSLTISLTRTCSGGYRTRNHIPRYLSIGSTLSLVVYFTPIYGLKWNETLSRWLIGTYALGSTACAYLPSYIIS